MRTSVSSGSGTFHFESVRIRSGWPWPDDAVRRGLEEQLRPRRSIDAVVARRGRRRFLHPGRLAPLVGDAGRPDFLLVDRRQQRDLLQRNLLVVASQKLGRLVGIVGLENFEQRAVLPARKIERQQ